MTRSRKRARTMILTGEYDTNRLPGIMAAGTYLRSGVNNNDVRPINIKVDNIEITFMLGLGAVAGILFREIMIRFGI